MSATVPAAALLACSCAVQLTLSMGFVSGGGCDGRACHTLSIVAPNKLLFVCADDGVRSRGRGAEGEAAEEAAEAAGEVAEGVAGVTGPSRAAAKTLGFRVAGLLARGPGASQTGLARIDDKPCAADAPVGLCLCCWGAGSLGG